MTNGQLWERMHPAPDRREESLSNVVRYSFFSLISHDEMLVFSQCKSSVAKDQPPSERRQDNYSNIMDYQQDELSLDCWQAELMWNKRQLCILCLYSQNLKPSLIYQSSRVCSPSNSDFTKSHYPLKRLSVVHSSVRGLSIPAPICHWNSHRGSGFLTRNSNLMFGISKDGREFNIITLISILISQQYMVNKTNKTLIRYR